MFANKEGVSLMQGEALLDIRKRPSRLEKGVSLISKYNYLYSHLPSSHILLVVFTPLSIRRGGGGEAVDGRGRGCRWTVVRLLSPINHPIKRRTPRALLYRTLGVATLLKYSFNNKNYYYLTLIVPNLTAE